MRRLLLLLLTGCTAFTAWAQDRPDGGRMSAPTEHQVLFSAGHLNVLDTYLSPLEYTGPSLGVLHRSERLARWGRGRVTVTGLVGGYAAYLHSPTDDGKEWEGQLAGAFGWHYNWRPAPGLRLALGGLAELSTGFTYNLRNGNNPAQGRLGASVALSAIASYDFRVRRRRLSARAQLDVPLTGAQFTPNYGQSYYEIFSLGHYDHNVRWTHPFNAPSARLLATFSLPLGRSTLSVGYWMDIRQSELNNLKRHVWSHQFVLGYVRRLRLCP